jgi:hypothetical protein
MKIAVLILSLFIHFTTEAASIKQKELNFTVNGEELLRGDVVYSVEVMSAQELTDLFPAFMELDTSGFTKPKNATLLVSKSAYIVDKPVGFFDSDKAENVEFLNHLLGEQKVIKLGERLFRVVIPGGQTYKLRTQFDSDDISTTTNSRAIRSVTGARKMDIQVQGASSVLVREMYDYSKGSYGSIHVTSFLTIKENKTLVIDFGLMSLTPPLLAKETLEDSVENEASAHQALLNSFNSP